MTWNSYQLNKTLDLNTGKIQESLHNVTYSPLKVVIPSNNSQKCLIFKKSYFFRYAQLRHYFDKYTKGKTNRKNYLQDFSHLHLEEYFGSKLEKEAVRTLPELADKT